MYLLSSFLSCSPSGPLGVVYGVAVAGNDYRVGRKQRNVVLDLWLDDRVRAMAVACGVSVNRFIVDVLEREVTSSGSGDGSSGVAGGASADQRGFGFGGGRDGSGVVGVGVGDGVEPRVSPDWDGIMAAGRAAKAVYKVDTVVSDPLEEIA